MAQKITHARLKREAQQAAFDAARKAIKPSEVYNDTQGDQNYNRFLYQDVLLAFAEAQHAWRRTSQAYHGRVDRNPDPHPGPLMDLGHVVGAAFLARNQPGNMDVHTLLEAGSQLCDFARVFTTLRLQGAMYRMLNSGVNGYGDGETSLGNDVEQHGDLDDLVEVGSIYTDLT